MSEECPIIVLDDDDDDILFIDGSSNQGILIQSLLVTISLTSFRAPNIYT